MNKFLHLSKYYSYQLFHSYAYIIMNIFLSLSPVLVVLLTYFLRDQNLSNSSFIISISLQVALIIQILFITIKLFNENKYNLSDIKLLGKNFFRNEIFWSKYFIIFVNAIILETLMSAFASFTMLGLNIKGKTIGALFASNFIGLLLNIFFFSSILIICSISFNRIWSPIISLLIVSISPLTSMVNNFLISNKSECNNINSNINDKNSFVQYNKIYKIDQNNKVIDTKYVYNYNYNNNVSTNLNTDIQNSINYTNQYNYLIPGNINISLQEKIYSSINNDISLGDYLMYNGSLAKIKPTNFENLSSYISDGYSYVLCNMNDQNYFELSETELSNLIIQDLETLQSKYEKLFNNQKELSGLLDELSKNKIWNFNNLNEKQTNFIFDLLGLNFSSFFYTWYYQGYLKGNIANLSGEIRTKFNNDAIANLIDFLWFTDNSYFNIILVESNQTQIIDFKSKMMLKYPINYMYDSNLMTSKKNLTFVMNDLVKIQSNQIFLLNDQGIYDVVAKEEFLKLFNLKNIEEQEDWINYLTIVNIPTVGFINNVYNKLSSIKPNLIYLNIQNNNFDLTSFNQVFDLSNEPFSSGWITTIIMQFSLILFFIMFAYIAYIKARLD